MLAGAALAHGAEPRRAQELYRAGKRAFADEQFAVAEGHFRQLLQNHPDSRHAAEAHLLLGEALFFQERFADAATTLSEGAEKHPQKLADAFRFWQAETAAQRGRFADAAAAYREVVENFPHSKYRAQALFGLADARFRAADLDGAQEAFTALLREAGGGPFAAEALVGLGKVHLARGAAATAERNFRAVQSDHARSRAVWLAHYWLAETRLHQGDTEGALEELRKITEAQTRVFPRDLRAEAWHSIGRAHLRREDYAAAAAAFEQARSAARSASLRSAAALQQAEALVRAGQTDSAIEQMRATEPITAPVLFRVAELLYGQRKFPEALATYREVVEKFPQHELAGWAHYGAGWSLLEMGRAAESVDEFARSVALGPTMELQAQAQFKIGDVHLAQRQFARAVEAYQAVLDRFGNSSVSARAQFQLGVTHAEAEDWAAAEEAWERLLERFPGSAYAERAQFQLGVARYNLKKWAEARRTFGALQANFPQSPLRAEAWLAVAHVWQAEGRYGEALAQYGDFPIHFRDHPLTPRAAFEYAHCVARMGDRARAKEEFAKFLENYPQHALAPQAQFWLAQERYAQKDFLAAQEAFAQLAHKYPESDAAAEALYWAGRAAMNRQAFQEARERVFEELIRRYPQSPRCADARFFQGESYRESGEFDKAIALYNELIRAYPSSSLVEATWGAMGHSLRTLRRFSEALAAYERVLQSERATPAQRNEAEFSIGRCLEETGQGDEALKRYLNVVYRAEATEREAFWFSRAALEAARLLEGRKDWARAAAVWNRLAAAGVAASEEARRRAEQIRRDHPQEF